ncbi:GNAT family N-acetyltransferase [Rhodococcus sp. NPDC058505]|uniref:GNAT family N-acetyltransferase n=1 Tax=unclassified Rhodococcus (in: high G+C Gram-positive bacteria) TaxID=192944 RepID=UPI0036478574
MLADKATAEVTNNAAQSRFELWLNGDLVGILGYYDLESNDGAARGRRRSTAPVVSFLHTVIVEDFGHRGLAALMVRRALDAARGYGWKIRPVCTYLQRFVAANPEYRDILVPV